MTTETELGVIPGASSNVSAATPDEPASVARLRAPEHTPGPWRLSHKGKKCTYIDAGGWRCFAKVVTTFEKDRTVEDRVVSAQGRANARLIAAAPDLLDALRPFAAFLDALEVMGGTTPKTGTVYSLCTRAGERDITVEDMKAARAAVAKAIGADGALGRHDQTEDEGSRAEPDPISTPNPKATG